MNSKSSQDRILEPKENRKTLQQEWWQTFFSGVTLDLWRLAVSEEQTRSEADFIQKALQLPPQTKLLDVPCGNGRLSRQLASGGYRMTGVDIASEFIEEAQSKSAQTGDSITWTLGDMRDLPWESEFDGAFCFGNSFGYLDDKGNADFLMAVSRTLKSGGRFVLDTGAIAESILPNFPERLWYRMGDLFFMVASSYNHVLGRIETDYTFVRNGKVETRPGLQRVYSYCELARMLQEAGFSDIEGYSSLNKDPFKLGSQRLLLVARKVVTVKI